MFHARKAQGPGKRGLGVLRTIRQTAATRIVRRILKRVRPSKPAPISNRVPGSGTPPPPPPVLHPGVPGGALSQVHPASEISLKLSLPALVGSPPTNVFKIGRASCRERV